MSGVEWALNLPRKYKTTVKVIGSDKHFSAAKKYTIGPKCERFVTFVFVMLLINKLERFSLVRLATLV